MIALSLLLQEIQHPKLQVPKPEPLTSARITRITMGTTITQVDTIPLTDLSGPASIPRPRSVITSHSVSQIPISRAQSPRVFDAEPTSTLNKSRRTLITTLVILASLTQVKSTKRIPDEHFGLHVQVCCEFCNARRRVGVQQEAGP